jgi:hypothetical protein
MWRERWGEMAREMVREMWRDADITNTTIPIHPSTLYHKHCTHRAHAARDPHVTLM